MHRTVIIPAKLTADALAFAIDEESNRMEAEGWELKAAIQTQYCKTLLTFWKPDGPETTSGGAEE